MAKKILEILFYYLEKARVFLWGKYKIRKQSDLEKIEEFIIDINYFFLNENSNDFHLHFFFEDFDTNTHQIKKKWENKTKSFYSKKTKKETIYLINILNLALKKHSKMWFPKYLELKSNENDVLTKDITPFNANEVLANLQERSEKIKREKKLFIFNDYAENIENKDMEEYNEYIEKFKKEYKIYYFKYIKKIYLKNKELNNQESVFRVS